MHLKSHPGSAMAMVVVSVGVALATIDAGRSNIYCFFETMSALVGAALAAKIVEHQEQAEYMQIIPHAHRERLLTNGIV